MGALKSRKNTLKQVKGYRFGRSTKEKQAFEAIMHAGTYAFAHRRDKKGDFRSLWIVRINAALRAKGVRYSQFIKALEVKKIALNRKVLSELAIHEPAAFEAVMKEAGVL